MSGTQVVAEMESLGTIMTSLISSNGCFLLSILGDQILLALAPNYHDWRGDGCICAQDGCLGTMTRPVKDACGLK